MLEQMQRDGAPSWRQRLGAWVESRNFVRFILGVIVLNAVVLSLETDRHIMEHWGLWLHLLDKACLAVFVGEMTLKIAAFRSLFWRNGWNVFDFLVIAVALVPGGGPWAAVRSLRVLRILRLLTVSPMLRNVVLAFFHAVPGLLGALAVMAVFFFTAALLATSFFGATFPQWFGSLGRSLYSLFQIMTLESWSSGIVRPVMADFPYAWIFFVVFILVATFTILNVFTGIIVSSIMRELSQRHTSGLHKEHLDEAFEKLQGDIQDLRREIGDR